MRFAHFQFDPETDRLGEGPLSEVYRAEDTQLGRVVALKILRAHAEIDPQADTRFQREAQHASSFTHKNITTIYEYGEFERTPYIAMEYLAGRTLDKIIKERLLGYEECLRIACQLSDALAMVHDHHLIHRDLKPGNVLLQDDGLLKLLDFGIARARDEAGITQHGMLVGTVLYMSPEQVRGEELDPRSDIFSLGALLYHVMTGALPFPGESFPEVCMAILEGRMRRPSEVRQGFPGPLEEFLLKCLQASPGDRFADARTAAGFLATVADRLTGTNSNRPATLRGILVLPEVACGGPLAKMCHVMAGGLRKDLVAELTRNKGLTIHSKELSELALDAAYDYVVRLDLSVVGRHGTLAVQVDFFENGKKVRSTEDIIEQEEEDEWALQEDLVRATMRMLRKRLSEARVQATAHLGGGRDIEKALALVDRALITLRKGRSKQIASALFLCRAALDLDRYCAAAYAAMAEALVRKFLLWDGDPTFLEEAREAAGKALALEPECAPAHTSLGLLNHLSGHHEDAAREYRLAKQLDAEEWMAYRLLGAIYAREGNFKGAAPLLQRAINLEPGHIASYDHLYTVLERLDRREEADEWADQGIAAARKHLTSVPDDMDARLHMALLYARLGNENGARRAAEEARQIAPKDAYTAFHVACVYALLGDVLEAIACLKLAQHRGYYMKSEVVRNTDLDVLRGLPEFQQLLVS
ncbi:MAG: serine/threonine-protein kinase [Planctomycetota bacterium]|nr:serine/threonine-protein kinase [Planctomycetota bacterium]